MNISGRNVSIPCIAGQWSLLVLVVALLTGFGMSLNPLHCGAVVASRCGRGSPA